MGCPTGRGRDRHVILHQCLPVWLTCSPGHGVRVLLRGWARPEEDAEGPRILLTWLGRGMSWPATPHHPYDLVRLPRSRIAEEIESGPRRHLPRSVAGRRSVSRPPDYEISAEVIDLLCQRGYRTIVDLSGHFPTTCKAAVLGLIRPGGPAPGRSGSPAVLRAPRSLTGPRLARPIGAANQPIGNCPSTVTPWLRLHSSAPLWSIAPDGCAGAHRRGAGQPVLQSGAARDRFGRRWG